MRLRENPGMRSIRDAVGEFMVAVGGQAVHHDDIWISFRNQLVIDLVGREDAFAFGSFFFLSHAGPGIRVDNIGEADRFMRVPEEAQAGTAAAGDFQGGFNCCAGHVKVLGVRDAEIRAHLGANLHEGYSHIVAVTHIGHVDAFELAEGFVDCERVGQSLTGVAEVAQSIDDGDVRPMGKLEHVLVLENTRHNAMNVTLKYACDIRHRLALAQADLIGGKVQSIPSQVARMAISKLTLVRNEGFEKSSPVLSP